MKGSIAAFMIATENFVKEYPDHKGSIAYWKEIGKWTADNQANTDALHKRNDVLAAAWKEFKSMTVSEAEYEVKWLAVRRKHLEAAGMAVPFPEPLEG